MNSKVGFFAVCFSVFIAANGSAAVLYVDLNCTNPTPPYADWSTAATDIQSAIDASSDGDQIWVNDGIYQTGGRVVYGSLTNRVVINKAVTVQSVNGPTVTLIQGYQVLGTIIGDSAIRCVYMTNNASLIGFTLTNGATRSAGDTIHEESGGGLLCESNSTAVVANCVLTGNIGYYWVGGAYFGNFNSCTFVGNYSLVAGGVFHGILNNCVLSNNTTGANGGGGATSFCNLTNCTLTRNSSFEGGGAYQCTLVDCTLSNNYVSGGNFNQGGGALGGTLIGCTITGNTADGGSGGGTSGSTLIGCTITGNIADGGGGGASGGTLSNCYIGGNSVTGGQYQYAAYGGGVSGSTLKNCTLAMNSGSAGGGAYNSYLNACLIISNGFFAAGSSTLTNCLLVGNNSAADNSILYNCTLVGNYTSNPSGVAGTFNCAEYNCILYYNTNTASPSGWNNYEVGSFTNCCTMPLPTNGLGNITNAPLFINLANCNYRLQTNSPCINAGNNSHVTASTDLDGRPRIVGGTVDMGAYEFQGPGIGEFIAWLQQYGLPTDGSADFVDSDGDGMNNWQEWIAGTIPTNAASFLQMLSASNSVSGPKVTWQSVSGKTYFMLRSTNLAVQPAFASIQSNLTGSAGTTSFTDTTATNGNSFFYRVGVQ